MKYKNEIKRDADTYYYFVSKAVMFITALLAVALLYFVYSMVSTPALVSKYYYAVPEMLKNILLICAAAVSVGALFEIATN